MTTLAENEDSIIRSALLIEEDATAIAKLVEIKDQNADTEDNREQLRSLITSRKFTDLEISSFRDLLNSNLLQGLYQNAVEKKSQSNKDITIAQDFLLHYFIDITNAKSAYEIIKRHADQLQNIIRNECKLTQSASANSGKFTKRKTAEIGRAVSGKDDAVIFSMVNTLYKQIIFGSLHLPAIQKKAARSKEFRSGSNRFSSVRNLIERIDEIPDDIFERHAKNNDFQKWLQGQAFGDDKKVKRLAKQTGRITSKQDLCSKIAKYSQEQEEKKFLKNKGKVKQDALLAARLFLQDMSPEMIQLIPFIPSKEGLKCLKVVQKYIQDNEQDQFKQELLAFLKQPFGFVQQKQAQGVALDRNFDFADYFKKRIEFNIRYKSGIDARIRKASEKFAEAGITTKTEYDESKELHGELNLFLREYSRLDLPDIEHITTARRMLNTKLAEADQLIEEQQMEFASARRALGKKASQLRKFLRRNPTERNISVCQESEELLSSYEHLNLKLDAALVPEHAEFLLKKEALRRVIERRKNEITTKFDAKNNEIRVQIEAKSWDTEQEIAAIDSIKKEAEKVVDLAKKFYIDSEADILTLIDDIDAVSAGYSQQKTQNIAEIKETIADFKLGKMDLEELCQDPEQLAFGTENSKIELACREIQNLEAELSEITERFGGFERDEGLASTLGEFEEAKAEIMQVINNAKELVHSEICAKTTALDTEVKQAYEVSQEIILLKNIELQAKSLADLAQTISYIDQDSTLENIQDIADKKIKHIQSKVERGEEKVANIADYIAKQYKQIPELTANITQKNALKSVLSILSRFPEKIAECDDWRGDRILDPEIKKLEARVKEIQTEVDETVDKAITHTAERAKAIKKRVKQPNKSTIIKALRKLCNKRVRLKRLSKGPYAEKAEAHLPEIEGMIEKAQIALANFKKGVDQDLSDAIAALNQEFEWSYDKKKIEDQVAAIEKIEQDAELLGYEEKNPEFDSAKSLVESKLSQLEKLIKTRKQTLEQTIKDNSSEAFKFALTINFLTNNRLIQKVQEAIDAQKANIDQYSAWKKDRAYADLFKKAKENISKFRTDMNNQILSEISKLDIRVQEISELAAVKELSPEETRNLNSSDQALEQQREKYLIFNKNIFKKTVAEKISALNEVKSSVAERLDALTDKLDKEIDDIAVFLNKNEFKYTQHLTILKEQQHSLDSLKEYCTALSNQDLLDAAARVESDITGLSTEINERFTERKEILDKLRQSLEEAYNDVDNLLGSELTDEKVAQCYLIHQSNEESIEKHDFAEWNEDDKVQEMHGALEEDAKALKQIIDERIFAEVTQIDAAAKQYASAVNAAALHTPEEVTELLDTETKLRFALEGYSNLLRHAHKDNLEAKQADIHTALKTAEDKISSLRTRLTEDIVEMERQANRDHKYTQDKEDLDRDIDKTTSLSAYLKALQADEELNRVEAARTEMEHKSAVITERVIKKRKELSDLHMRIIDESQEKLEKLWNHIEQDNNLEEAHGLLKELQQEVHKQGHWRMDDSLASLFNSIDTSLAKLQNYQATKASKVIEACSFELMILEQTLMGYDTHRPNLIKAIQEKEARVKEIDELLKRLKKASPENDVKKTLEATAHILDSAKQKYHDAREEIDEKVSRVLDRLHTKEFNRIHHIPELADMQAKLTEQKELCKLVDHDTAEIEFLLDYASKEIHKINTSSETEKEKISAAEDKLKYFTNALFSMLDQPLTPGTLKTALQIFETARKEADIGAKEHKTDDLQMALAGLEIKTDQEVETALDNIVDTANNYMQDVHDAGKRKLRRIKKKLKQKQAQCDALGQGKYVALADEKKAEISKHLTGLEDMTSMRNKNKKDLQERFSKNRKKLLKLYDEVITLEKSLAEKTDITEEYILAVTRLGKQVRSAAMLYNFNARGATEKDASLLQRMRKETIDKQKAVCDIIQKEIDNKTAELMTDWHAEDDNVELKQICGALRNKRKTFVKFKNSLIGNNVNRISDLNTAYKTLIQRAIAIKQGQKEGLLKGRQLIIDLKDRYLEFGERSKEIFTQIMDELPDKYIEKVREFDEDLRAMQQATIELDRTTLQDKYSQELLVELLNSTAYHTRQFAKYISHIKDAVEQKEKLKDANLLKSRLGGLRTKIRKLTKIIARAPPEQASEIQELEDVRQYHLSLYED